MRTFLLVGMGIVIGIISILSLPFAFGHNEDNILARLKKVEEKISYREKAFPIMLRSVSNGPKNHVWVKIPDSKNKGFSGCISQKLNIYTDSGAGNPGTSILSLCGSYTQNAFGIMAWKAKKGGSLSNLVLQPQGKVGIGTANPKAKLHVAGKIKANVFEMGAFSIVVQENRLYIYNSNDSKFYRFVAGKKDKEIKTLVLEEEKHASAIKTLKKILGL